MENNFEAPTIPAEIDDNLEKKIHGWLKGVLATTPATITFTKVDGTERWLHCTLHPEHVPLVENKEAPQRKLSGTTQSVWDIDAQGWRSFRWDSVREFSFNLGDLHV